MTNYINTTNNQYPVTETEIRNLFPNSSFPFPFVAPDEYKVVFPAPIPQYDQVTQGYREIAPALTDKGHYEQKYEVFNLDAEVVNSNKQQAMEQLKQAAIAAVQFHMDTKVKERNYDSILSACTYATSTNTKFAAEGQACVVWRDQVWSKCYEILAGVESGNTAPTVEEVLSQLPSLVWPE